MKESYFNVRRNVVMRKFLAQKILIVFIAAASVWSIQTYALSSTHGDPVVNSALPRRTIQQQAAGELWNRTELYFGSSKPDGSVVSEKKFQRFVDEEITPRFPDGLTVLTGNGQFRISSGVIIKERSMVLILFYPPDMQNADQNIEQIREAYKRAFQQESVLRVDSQATISF